MPFDFGGGSDMYGNTVNASEGLKTKLKSVYGWDDATAYAHMGISGMNGLSDQQETTTPAIWTQIKDWANSKHLARLAFWSVNATGPARAAASPRTAPASARTPGSSRRSPPASPADRRPVSFLMDTGTYCAASAARTAIVMRLVE